MATKTRRKIVKIDEAKCDGCGLCIPACAEGALQIINGKAKLIGDIYCDGLGACLGTCPNDAITIEEREAETFADVPAKNHPTARETTEDALPCGCASATVTQIDRPELKEAPAGVTPQVSRLGHWPVQLTLVPPSAPFLQDADLLLAADCVPFAYAGFHQDFIQDHAVLVACPKLDDFPAHLERLTEILRMSSINKSITVVHMEVPCCSGLVHMARQAVQLSGKDIPLREITIDIKGDRSP